MPAGAFGTFVKTRPTGLGQATTPAEHFSVIQFLFTTSFCTLAGAIGSAVAVFGLAKLTRTHTPRSTDEHLFNASGYRIGFRKNWRVLAAPRWRRGALSSVGIRLACLTFVAAWAATKVRRAWPARRATHTVTCLCDSVFQSWSSPYSREFRAFARFLQNIFESPLLARKKTQPCAASWPAAPAHF